HYGHLYPRDLAFARRRLRVRAPSSPSTVSPAERATWLWDGFSPGPVVGNLTTNGRQTGVRNRGPEAGRRDHRELGYDRIHSGRRCCGGLQEGAGDAGGRGRAVVSALGDTRPDGPSTNGGAPVRKRSPRPGTERRRKSPSRRPLPRRAWRAAKASAGHGTGD